jgi:hypothetical protein
MNLHRLLMYSLMVAVSSARRSLCSAAACSWCSAAFLCVVCHRSPSAERGLLLPRTYARFGWANVHIVLKVRPICRLSCPNYRVDCRTTGYNRSFRPFVVFRSSYPQLVVLYPLIPSQTAATVESVLSVRASSFQLIHSPRRGALAKAQKGSDTRLQILL